MSENSFFDLKSAQKCQKPNLKISWMPKKRVKNGLKIYWISKKLLWLYLNTLKVKNFVHFKTFYKILTKFLLWFLNHFDSLLGKKWTQLPLERIVFHWGMSKKKIQLKIPTLSKNDYSATWCPNCYNKKTTPGKLRNGHRYEKHVVIFRPTLLTVADLFKPTVNTLSNLKIHLFAILWSKSMGIHDSI